MGEAVCALEMPPSPLLTDSKNRESARSKDERMGGGALGGGLFAFAYCVHVVFFFKNCCIFMFKIKRKETVCHPFYSNSQSECSPWFAEKHK